MPSTPNSARSIAGLQSAENAGDLPQRQEQPAASLPAGRPETKLLARSASLPGYPVITGLHQQSWPGVGNSALTSGAFLVPAAGQQLADLAGDLAAELLHLAADCLQLAPEALDLGAQPVIVPAQPVIIRLKLGYVPGQRP